MPKKERVFPGSNLEVRNFKTNSINFFTQLMVNYDRTKEDMEQSTALKRITLERERINTGLKTTDQYIDAMLSVDKDLYALRLAFYEAEIMLNTFERYGDRPASTLFAKEKGQKEEAIVSPDKPVGAEPFFTEEDIAHG
jgi:hypothetical protein